MSTSPTNKLIMAFLSEFPLVHLSKNDVHSPILKVFRKNEIIFREGEGAKALFLLWKGKVLIGKKKDSGISSPERPGFDILDTLKPGEMLGLVGVLSNLSYTTSAVAVTKVHTFEVLKEEFLHFLIEHPSSHLSVAEKLSRKIVYYERILSSKA